MLEVWLPLLLCAGAALVWQHVLRLREHATGFARALCQEHGLQLLDDSVALHRLHAGWRHGRLHFTREYRFDTSRGGDHRQTATLTLRGGRVVASRLPADAAATPAVPVATSPFVASSLPPTASASGNVVPFTRRRPPPAG